MPSYKRSKILVITLVFLMLSTVFAYGVSINSNGTMYSDIPAYVSNSETNSENLSTLTSHDSTSKGELDITSNQSIATGRTTGHLLLGNVSTSYLNDIYVPVMLENGSSFQNLNQIFSYDPTILVFKSVLNDVSSQNVTFSNVSLSSGLVQIKGNRDFVVDFYNTTLYYLVFSTDIRSPMITSVTLDESTVGNLTLNVTMSSTVTLVRGWTSYGPKNVSFISGVPPGVQGPRMSAYETGETNAVGFSPYDLSIIYAGSGWFGNFASGGMIKSTDGGKNWTLIDLGLNYAQTQSIWVDPDNPDVVVVIADLWMHAGGIFKTVNGGLSWQEVYNGGGTILQSIPNGTLYAFLFNSVLVSYDAGDTWKIVYYSQNEIGAGLILHGGKTIEIGVQTVSNNYPYQGVLEMLESNNGGLTFVFAGFFPASYLVQMTADPANSSIQWLDEFIGYEKDGLYKSNDGGLSWELVNYSSIGISSYANDSAPNVIVCDPLNPSIVYLGGDAWLSVSDNGGTTFNQFMNVATAPDTVVVDPLNDSVVFIGGEQGLFVSYNKGLNWTSLNDRSSSLTEGISVDGNDALVTLGNYIPTYTVNNGSTWPDLSPRYIAPNGSVYRFEGGVTTVDPYNSSIVLFAAGFMLVSHNGGLNYTFPQINQSGVDNPDLSEMSAFVFVPNSSTIYYPGKSGIYVSSDGGYDWAVLSGSPKNCTSIAGSSSNGTFTIYASNSTGLYYSRNDGATWIFKNSLSLETMSIDPESPNIIAATVGNEVMISNDYGLNFRYANESSTYTIITPGVVFQENLNGKVALYFVSDGGIFRSDDLGASWKEISFNLPIKEIFSMEVYNWTPYVATWGAGVWYDPQLFDLDYSLNEPILSGYLPSEGILTVDGTIINKVGYFSMEIKSGNNTIDWKGENSFFVASEGSIYFFNFSNLQVFLTVKEKNLPTGTEWNVSANGRNYSIIGNGSLTLPPSTSGIYVLPVATDYSIYYPLNNFYPLNSSLVSSITVQFDQSVRAVYRNVSSSMNGMFWSTQIAYNRGYILYAGGTVGLLNVTSDEGQRLQSPDYSGTADSAVPFGTGFLVGGSASQDRPGIYYYDVSTGEFTNFSVLLPASWNASSSAISSLFVVNSSAFGFIGGGVDSAYFGIVDGGEFINLTPYLPSSFTPSNGWYNRYSGAYLSSCEGFVLSDGTDIGIFYLQNKSFHDISQLMPNGFFVGMPGNEWSPSSDFITSNGTTAIITGVDNMRQFTVLYSPDTGIRNISDLFPSFEHMDSVTWQGGDIVLSGHESNGNSSSIFIYNATRQIPTAINTTYYGNTSMIDSAIRVGNSVYFTTFNVKPVLNQSYVVLSSYYGAVELTPTGCINVRVNTPSSIEINNETYFATTASIPEFTGNYTLTVFSPGYATYATRVNVSPFKNLYLNVILETKTYGITFTEDGLPSGISWSVTFNGTTESSTSNSITFQEPNGTYSFSVVNVTGYNVVPASGNIVVSGKPAKESISFTQITQEGYFVGSVSPPNATISILVNGSWVSYKEDNGSFNISLIPGTYRVSISAPRCTAYVTNITVSSLTVTSLPIHTLSKVSKPSSFPVSLLVIAIVIIVAFAVAAVALVRFRKRT